MSNQGDGSILSSYFSTTPGATGKDVYNQGIRLCYGQLEKLYFVDDAANVSKTFVEYDVSVRDAHGGQSTFRNVRSLYSFFGFNDFDETILEVNETALSGKLDPSNFFKNKNGNVVILAFIDGSKDKPVIIGALNHPRKTGAKRADGVRKKGEFRGFAWEINKLGELILTYNGNRKPDGKLERQDTGPTVIKIDKAGVFSISDNKGQKLEINRTTNVISFSNGTIVSLDGQSDKITLQTKGGAKITIDGTADSVIIEDKSGGKIKVAAGKIAIGNSTAELLQQISDQLDKIATWANSVGATHTHLGNLGFPTAPPTQASGYTQLGSDLQTIKGKVDGIKGSL